MVRSIIVLFLASLTGISQLKAQTTDFGMWYEVGAEKKLNSKWSLSGESELRTRNNTRTIDRWSVGLGAEYKIVKKLKLQLGYTFMNVNKEEEFDLKKDGLRPNKWTPSFWNMRQRLYVGLSGNIDWGRLNISLRERYQFTYRHAGNNKKYDFDNDEWKDVNSKTRHVFRSRLQLSYDIPHWKFDPFANVEMFNGKGGIEKMRYQAGFEYKYKKQHAFTLTYRFQKVNGEDDDDDTNSHLIGLGYKYKF